MTPLETAMTIRRVVAGAFRLKPADLTGRCRDRAYVRPRHIAWHIAAELTALSVPEIAQVFDRDPKTMRDTLVAMRFEVAGNAELALMVTTLQDRVLAEIPDYVEPARQRLRCSRAGTESKPRPPVSQVKDRTCLKCRDSFTSEGPHNRICQTCKPGIAQVAPIMEGVTW